MMHKLDNPLPLWDFACRVYDLAEVATHCLTLQNQYAADVDIILWLCWLQFLNIRVDVSVLGGALIEVDGVQRELLNNLRRTRALLKNSDIEDCAKQKIRTHILDAELLIEKVLLERLEELTVRLTAVEVKSSLTLQNYLLSLNVLHAQGEAEFFERKVETLR